MLTRNYYNGSKFKTDKLRSAVDSAIYQCLMGRLVYLSHTQLEITFRKHEYPIHAYLIAVYLQAKGILFERNGGEVLEAYTNIDYAMSLL
jgi:hypothetical protein